MIFIQIRRTNSRWETKKLPLVLISLRLNFVRAQHPKRKIFNIQHHRVERKTEFHFFFMFMKLKMELGIQKHTEPIIIIINTRNVLKLRTELLVFIFEHFILKNNTKKQKKPFFLLINLKTHQFWKESFFIFQIKRSFLNLIQFFFFRVSCGEMSNPVQHKHECICS